MTKQLKSSPTKPSSKSTKKPKGATKGVYISKKRLALVSTGIFTLAVSTVVVFALFATQIIVTQTNKSRLNRIENIYSNLEVGEEYQLEGQNVFGQKRVYDWDKGRTYSSVKYYLRGASVSETVADLDAKIKAAGFSFTGEPYPGAVDVQYHYKSENNEYIRLTVASKMYRDAIRNAAIMKQEITDEIFSMDKNVGPAIVTIKVNLDDNNE